MVQDDIGKRLLDVLVEFVANFGHVLLRQDSCFIPSLLVLLGLVLWFVAVLNCLARGNVCRDGAEFECVKSFVTVPLGDSEEFIDFLLF